MRTLKLPNPEISKFPDLTGRRIRNVTVVEQISRTDRFTRWWLCVCDCGKQVTVSSAQLGRSECRLCNCHPTEKLTVRQSKIGIDRICLFCKTDFWTIQNKTGRSRVYCSASCKNTHWRLAKGTPALPQIVTPSGEVRTCQTCQLSLPVGDYHKSYKILASGNKRYYFSRICRLCEYEVAKPRKRLYYLENKHLVKNAPAIQQWRQKNARLGKCLNCGRKPEKAARLCVYCHIEHWIGSTIYNIKKNAHKTLPAQVLEQRAAVLRSHKPVLLKLPGAGNYPNKRLGHIVSVRQDPNGSLLATNIQWVEHKARGPKVSV